MKKKTQVQVIRKAVETWEVHVISELWDATSLDYELAGRVIKDGKLYYAEIPKWHLTGFTWERQTRGYLIPRAAIRALTEKKAVLQ